MERNSEVHNDLHSESNSELGAAGTQDFSLDNFEIRLQDLERCMQELKANSPLPWLTSREKIFDATLDLRVKLDAVRWMLRVSKHLGRPARERVLLTIGKSLDQLEKVVEPTIRAA